MRSLGALVADAVMIVVFTAVGLTQHGLPLTTTTVGLVAWPFAIGLLLGHLAIRAWRRPFAIWPQGVFVWAITVVAAMAIRTLFGAAPQASFVLVTAGVLGVLLLGWRAVASWMTRHEQREVIELGDLRPGSSGRDDGRDGGPDHTTPGSGSGDTMTDGGSDDTTPDGGSGDTTNRPGTGGETRPDDEGPPATDQDRSGKRSGRALRADEDRPTGAGPRGSSAATGR